jgi:protease I
MKSLPLILIIAIIAVGLVIFFGIKKPKNMPQVLEEKTMGQEITKTSPKKIAMIIAQRDFRDEEYFLPREEFLRAGFEVKTVAKEKGIAIGASGGEANVDLTFGELNVDDFDAVVFVGGPGAYKYVDDPQVHQVAKSAKEKEKVLAAICIAPTILARAGVLEGKKATVWSSVLDKSPIKILEEEGAIYQDRSVVQDEKIITANGPQAAKEFGQKIIEVLSQ